MKYKAGDIVRIVKSDDMSDTIKSHINFNNSIGKVIFVWGRSSIPYDIEFTANDGTKKIRSFFEHELVEVK